MKEFLVGMGLGFMVGAIAVKSCKPMAELADKTKKAVKDKIDDMKSEQKSEK